MDCKGWCLLHPIDRLDRALFSFVKLYYQWFLLLEYWESFLFLPRSFPAVLIIFAGQGGEPPFPTGRGVHPWCSPNRRNPGKIDDLPNFSWKNENPCYLFNRCTFDILLHSVSSSQCWAILIFSPSAKLVTSVSKEEPDNYSPKSQPSWQICFCCWNHLFWFFH